MNTLAGNGRPALDIGKLSSARLFNASAITTAYVSGTKTQMEERVVEEQSQRAIPSRNKDNYLKAKAAFNQKDMAGCMSYYAPDHHLRSRDVGPGRQHIERVLSSTRESWPDLVIVVEHAVAEDDWVVGRCTTTATHTKAVLGVAPTNRQIQATFWDMHRFDADGRIVETWNLTDSLAIMQQLGLVPTPPK
ncbi:MAG: ester cyclase [Bradyrhizobium sp.]|nr:ester cyclase [Bradyrhizobium sp.]